MISRRRRSTERRLGSLDKARLVLRAIADGSRDPYEGYREVYGIYLGAVEELKPLFRLPDIYPDGPIHVDDAFRRTIITAAVDWLQNNHRDHAGPDRDFLHFQRRAVRRDNA